MYEQLTQLYLWYKIGSACLGLCAFFLVVMFISVVTLLYALDGWTINKPYYIRMAKYSAITLGVSTICALGSFFAAAVTPSENDIRAYIVAYSDDLGLTPEQEAKILNYIGKPITEQE